jgi:hypothetical protein
MDQSGGEGLSQESALGAEANQIYLGRTATNLLISRTFCLNNFI